MEQKTCVQCGKAGAEKTCSACKVESYCSIDCQKKAWKLHKPLCKKPEEREEDGGKEYILTKEDQDSLINIIRTQFVDISKVLGLVDPTKAA